MALKLRMLDILHECINLPPDCSGQRLAENYSLYTRLNRDGMLL
jgi:hypothetical protein